MAEVDAQLAVFGRSQHGLVTRAQALTVMTRRQLEWRVADGRLERVRPSVYRFAAAPPSWEQAVLAACLTAAPDTYASFHTAARLWLLPGFETDDRIEITTPSGRRARVDGVVVHESGVRGRRHVTQRAGLPVSTVARTLCDLSACCPPDVVERALDDALHRRLTTLRSLRGVHGDLAGPGRRGTTLMRALLRARRPGLGPADRAQATSSRTKTR